jgi:DNA-binding CsgD family transcriptional regulator
MRRTCTITKEEMEAHLAEELSLSAIARRTGWSTTTIMTLCSALGLSVENKHKGEHPRMPVDRGVLAEMRERGLSLSAIARELGLSYSVVWKNFHAFKLPAGAVRRGPPSKVLDRDVLAGLLAKGMTYAEIARELGCYVRIVSAHCQKYGLPRPKVRGHNPRASEEEFIALVTGSNLTLTEIARRIGVHTTSVHRRAKRLGLPTSLKERKSTSRHPRKLLDQDLIALTKAGKTNAGIARLHGLDRSSVSRRRSLLAREGAL